MELDILPEGHMSIYDSKNEANLYFEPIQTFDDRQLYAVKLLLPVLQISGMQKYLATDFEGHLKFLVKTKINEAIIILKNMRDELE